MTTLRIASSAAALTLLPAGSALAAPHWSSPKRVVAPAQNPGTPQALFAPDGAPRGFGSDGTNPVALTGSIASGLTAAPITTASNGTARGAIGANGTTAAAWSDSTRAFVAVAPPAGGFGEPVQLAGGRVGDVDVAVSPDGTTTVIWRSRDGGTYQASVAQAPPGGGFGAPQVFDTGASPISTVDAAAGADGTVAVAYTRNAGGYRVKAALKAPGAAGFDTPQTLSDPNGTDLGAEIAVASDGTAVAAWANPQGAKAAFRRPGQAAFEAPVDVGPGGYSLQLEPTPQGGTALTYAGSGSVWAAVQAPGGGFGAVQAVGAAPGNIPPAPSIATDAAGTTMVAYADSPTGEVRVATLGGATTLIGYGTAGTLTPVSIAASGTNRAIALWRDGEGGISSATYGEDAPASSGPGPKPAAPDRTGPRVTAPGSKTVKVARGAKTVKLTLTLSEPAALGLFGDLRTEVRRKKRVAPITSVDIAKAKLRRAGRQTVTLQLGRKASADLRRAFAAKRAGRLYLRISARDAASNTSETTLRLTLKEKPKRVKRG